MCLAAFRPCWPLLTSLQPKLSEECVGPEPKQGQSRAETMNLKQTTPTPTPTASLAESSESVYSRGRAFKGTCFALQVIACDSLPRLQRQAALQFKGQRLHRCPDAPQFPVLSGSSSPKGFKRWRPCAAGADETKTPPLSAYHSACLSNCLILSFFPIWGSVNFLSLHY